MVKATLLERRTAEQSAVGSARTCYSGSGPIVLDQETYDRRPLNEEIRKSTLEAGHNTTRQHLYFTFSLEGVSRQAIWSFLHSHPFYNSEQVSQRYVEVKAGNFTVPQGLTEGQRQIYDEGIALTFDAYKQLQDILRPSVEEEYLHIFPGREKWLRDAERDKTKHLKYSSDVKKRAQEFARYVLPVATHAHMWHTVSALTLMRMYQCADQFNVPTEQRSLVDAMVQEVVSKDPSFQKELDGLTRYGLEDSLEFKLHQEFHSDRGVSQQRLDSFRKEFDAELAGRFSVLIGYDPKAEENLAKAVRSVLQVSKTDLPDERAMELVLNPQYNRALGDTNNIMTFTKIGSALSAVSYTFQKRISHTADSQNQRHRMVPETTPIFNVGDVVDVVLPGIVEQNSVVREYFMETMDKLWGVMNRLRDAEASEEAVQYLAPNAIALRLVEQGDLRNRHHKYRMRLCYTAQEEIWRSCVDEAQQIAAVHPQIGKYLLPPCGVRNLAGLKPICPEGERYCGVKVWRKEVNDYERVI